MIVGFIPSRLEFKRIYQKPLLKIDGLPIIIHTMKRACYQKNLMICMFAQIVEK